MTTSKATTYTVRIDYDCGMERLELLVGRHEHDDAQALAIGTIGHDGVFHATALQAKCASKYAPAQPGGKPGMTPQKQPAPSNTNPRANAAPVPQPGSAAAEIATK